ncbi:unnamed protein product [Adineta ricciae]|uniref:Uncharacterized protein n=1 Tax=Adineta ricciae TaxID=249248 RepID=A0A814FS54_ADIRI|nr:unnamed protein product [Adineta ricciae]
MLNKCMYVILLIVSLHCLSILAFNHSAILSSTEPNVTFHAWTNDTVAVKTVYLDAKKWLFDNYTLAEYDGEWIYCNSSKASEINAIIGEIDDADSYLSLNNVKSVHNGSYTAYNDGNMFQCSMNLRVYHAELNAVDVVLRKVSNTCKAYLRINDSVTPLDYGVGRIINSAHLIVNQTNLLNATDFEIINSSLNEINNSMRIDVDVQYTLAQNNSVQIKSPPVDIGRLIETPNVVTFGSSNNCTILLQHNRTKNIECVRNISYCFKINDTSTDCYFSDNVDQFELEYRSNLTSINLEIQYDIIYGKQRFNLNIVKCLDEPTTILTSTIQTSVPTQMTSSESYTSEYSTSESTSIYSDSTYLTVPTAPVTTPPTDKERNSLSACEIAWIAVGSLVGAAALIGGIGFCVWKKNSASSFVPDIQMINRSSTQTPKSEFQSRDRRQSTTSSLSSTSSSEPSERPRLNNNHHRRHISPPPQSSNRSAMPSRNEERQSTRPVDPPTTISYETDKHKRRQNRRRGASPNNDLQAHSTRSHSPHPIQQHEVTRGRRRPLPPISYD